MAMPNITLRKNNGEYFVYVQLRQKYIHAKTQTTKTGGNKER